MDILITTDLESHTINQLSLKVLFFGEKNMSCYCFVVSSLMGIYTDLGYKAKRGNRSLKKTFNNWKSELFVQISDSQKNH